MRPVLRNALFRGNVEGFLSIEATDMEVGVKVLVKTESLKDPGAGVLPCHAIAKLLVECKDEVVSLDVSIEPQKPVKEKDAQGVETEHEQNDLVNAALFAGLDVYEIPGMGHQDFPEQLVVDAKNMSEIAPSDLDKLLARAIPSAATSQGRYAINGVYLESEGKMLNVVATDGTQLSLCKLKLKTLPGFDNGVILPLKMAAEMRRLCEDTTKEESVHFALSGKHFVAWNSTTTLSSVLAEGIFPKYKQVIPKDLDKEIVFNRDALISALRRASVLSEDGRETKTAQFDFSANACTLTNVGIGNGKATIKMVAEYTGDDFSIMLNPTRLLNGVGSLAADTVRISMKDATRPIIVHEGQDFAFVLMAINPKEMR
jgi:DNA polymerase-3 subunit beta